jgi:hypothetical protein
MKVRRELAVGLAFLAAGCGLNAIPGSGHVTSDRRTVGAFMSVELEGTGKVVILQNGIESLTIEADDNLVQYLTSDVRDGRLVLGIASSTRINPSRDVIYRVSVKQLDGIVLSGSGTIDATGISSDALTMAVNGSGDIRVEGRADQQEISINGSGDYKGANLKGKTVAVHIAGSGGGVVAASERLDVTMMGSGSIEYIGDPKVTQTSLGSGSVKKRP